MGIPVIVEVADGEVEERAIDQAFRWLAFVDETFSTYSPDSEISRLNAGTLSIRDAHPAVQSVLSRCEQLRRQTSGYFDIAAAAARRRAGAAARDVAGVAAPERLREASDRRAWREVDPSGFVKGWAIEGAGRILSKAGARNWYVNAGGDICLSGGSEGQGGWRVGVQHPRRRMAVAAVLELSGGAVATSGAYERGQHIIDPHRGAPPEGVLSVTITGASLSTIDAYATAAFAMGVDGAKWAARLPRCGAIVILDDETICYSAGVERHLRQDGGEARGEAAPAGVGIPARAA